VTDATPPADAGTSEPAEAVAVTPPTGKLEIDNVAVLRGGRRVVHDVSLQIPAGEITALLGPNGAGKSTLVLAIGGVLKPVAGKVVLDGKALTGRRPEKIRASGLAIVPEGRRLLSDLTVEDNLRVATYTLARGEADQARERALEMFPELKARLGARARSLSGGEQQMVVLAQALVTAPRYIVIDELSLGLAPVVINRLLPTIRSLADNGIGVLLIEQFATIALALANRAHIMEGGTLQYSGTAQELKQNPELLRNAYLLRGAQGPNGAARAGAPSGSVQTPGP
jgi:branched-chain amino acid transport system ATP-binding protein